MSVLRRGTASPRTPSATIVHAEASPYGSRRLVVESDGEVTSAYLRDARDSVIGAVWVANHRKAPSSLDRPRLDAGGAPLLPESHVAHPQGREAIDVSALEVVWFEEGDGVAVLEAGDPLFVIPGWSDMGRGIPGYARDATEQSPFAFPMEEEIAEFGPRIERAREHWKMCRADGSWAEFQQSVLGHLLQRLGPGGHYWHDVGRQLAGGKVSPSPTVGVTERPARGDRGFTVLSTVGMSRQRMPTVELYEDDVAPYARIELAVASTLPSQRAGSIFPWLAQYPWRSVTWFAPGDVVKWYHEPRTFPLGSGDSAWEGVLLLEDPSRLAGPEAPALTGLTLQGDPVRWLWLVPISGEEHRYAKSEGSDALIRRLAQQGRSWVVS
ncbi:suppressor of fused domain protein [Actinomadura nitritigenes]|uniref:Suppressor of fused domain protein n=1 Tax=Actinomadura nitritigenes TaxID=134602 RepID=A0ABS3QSQ2_9ACTN|nr:suppressor of fused domain protein [Actinomadura nitritigenes]MBO2437009.1 suppressor of fused domain protein [Actinomadura nitritigenes]